MGGGPGHFGQSYTKYYPACPDAVLGNQFIRVFLHNPDRQQNNMVDLCKLAPKLEGLYNVICSLTMFPV